MRPIPIATIAAAALLMSAVGAHAGTWCVQYGGKSGRTNCGFYSFQQCETARSGKSGFCVPNSFTAGPAGSAYGYVRQEPRRRYRRD